MSAKYVKNDSTKLDLPTLYKALARVIQEHPALSIIGISQPSDKTTGHHRLWEARIPRIDLNDVVKFVDDISDDDLSMAQIFEAQHNQQFDTEDFTKPWWRIIVINAHHVIFVYHHSIGDGISGYAFHRSLLAALNASETEDMGSETPPSIVESPTTPPNPYPIYEITDKLSWLHVIYNFLFWSIVRFFISQKYFLFSDAVFPKTFPTVLEPFTTGERTISKVQILRINREIMTRCLLACRENATSFTALLHTLTLVTLASDIYPNAKLGFSRLAVNIRPLLKKNPGPDSFTNAGSQYGRAQLLGKYRDAGRNPESGSSQLFESHVNKDLIWKLARNYKDGLNNAIYKSRSVLQDFLTGQLLGEDEEEVGTLYGLGLYQNNSFLMSNIGVFSPKVDMADNGWSVIDVAFSAGTIRAALGDVGIILNVASAQSGDCVICSTYEEGVLKDDMVQSVLEGILKRLKLVI